jgi:hypothetical protein
MAEQGTDRIGSQRLLRNDNLPNRVDLRPSLPTVRDQGARSVQYLLYLTRG